MFSSIIIIIVNKLLTVIIIIRRALRKSTGEAASQSTESPCGPSRIVTRGNKSISVAPLKDPDHLWTLVTVHSGVASRLVKLMVVVVIS